MTAVPSWKWLSSPFTRAIEVGGQKEESVSARPCLATIEQLDDRIFLDATAPASTVGDGGGTQAILIGLLKSGAALSVDEFGALGTIKGESKDHKHKDEIALLGHEFLKIDRILAEFGNDVLGGATGDSGGALLKLNEAFLKIDGVVADLGRGNDGALLPAVQKVREAALGDGSVYKLISALPGNLNGLSTDDLHKVMKISDLFVKIDGFVLKSEVDVLQGHVIDKLELADRLSDAFLKIDGLIGWINNTDLKSALNGFEKQFEDILGQGSFTGGVFVVGGTLT
jgi:hypothetical protein